MALQCDDIDPCVFDGRAVFGSKVAAQNPYLDVLVLVSAFYALDV